MIPIYDIYSTMIEEKDKEGIDQHFCMAFADRVEKEIKKEILKKIKKIRILMIKEHKGEFQYGNAGYRIAVQSFADRLEKQLKEDQK